MKNPQQQLSYEI